MTWSEERRERQKLEGSGSTVKMLLVCAAFFAAFVLLAAVLGGAGIIVGLLLIGAWWFIRTATRQPTHHCPACDEDERIRRSVDQWTRSEMGKGK